MAINSRSSRKSSWVQVGVILDSSSILLAISSVSSRGSSKGLSRIKPRSSRGHFWVISGSILVNMRSSWGQDGVKSGSTQGQVGFKSWSIQNQSMAKLWSNLLYVSFNMSTEFDKNSSK